MKDFFENIILRKKLKSALIILKEFENENDTCLELLNETKKISTKELDALKTLTSEIEKLI